MGGRVPLRLLGVRAGSAGGCDGLEGGDGLRIVWAQADADGMRLDSEQRNDGGVRVPVSFGPVRALGQDASHSARRDQGRRLRTSGTRLWCRTMVANPAST